MCRCAAHTAQLCALDVMKDPNIKRRLINCRNVVKFIKKNCNGYREIFELKKLNLPQLDCPTRWGSTYNMVCNVYKAKEVLQHIESIKNQSHDENFELSNDFWNFVSSYCAIFEPLQNTIIKFQEEQLHYGNFYAQWLKCKIMTNKVLETNAEKKDFQDIGKKLLHCIESRTTKLLKNESLNACLFLDPRFSHTLSADRKHEAINYLKRLYDRIKATGPIMPEKNKNLSEVYANETNDDLEEEDEYLNESLLHNMEPHNEDDMDVYSKIQNLKLPHQRAGRNVLGFWIDRQFTDPELFELANICFAIPPTQVTIERAFSSLKLILSDNRNRLNHETLENILMVKLNPSFLDKSIDELPLFEGSDADQNEDL